MHRQTTRKNESLHKIAQGHPDGILRVTALGCLLATGELIEADLSQAFDAEDPRVVRVAIELAEPLLQDSPSFARSSSGIAERKLGSQVDLQWLLTALSLPHRKPQHPLGR